jgi:hypothetical protein
MSNDPREAFDYNKKQRLQLLANLIADKIKEDIAQGQPLLKRIEVGRIPKRKAKLNKQLPKSSK